MIKSKPKFPDILLGGDIIALLLIAFFSVYLINNRVNANVDWLLLPPVAMLWLIFSNRKEIFRRNLLSQKGSRFVSFMFSVTALVCISSLILYLYPELNFDRNLIVFFIVGVPLLGVSVNYLLLNVVDRFKHLDHEKKYTLVAGVGNLAADVEKQLDGCEIKGFIKCKNEECLVRQDRVIGEVESIHEYLKNNSVDEIVIAIPIKLPKKIRNVLQAADYHGIRVKYIPDYQSVFGKHYRTKRLGKIEAVNVREFPLDATYSSFIKNSFDKIFSLLVLLFFMPVFLVLAILIKLDSPGPVFYCPIRIGKAGKPFRVFKFRSMRENDEVSGGLRSTEKNDPRITAIGKFMRKYSLDEMPQFLNVLLGSMSVVGPRPHRSYLNQQFQASEDKYMIRHYFKPGITGWAQVNGWRGPTETKEQKRQRTLHDIWYMENWSLSLDIKIILMTVFSRKAHKAAF
ncbi:exopolysaccharide biosynthesis polyprenyl glycosylphosphotransferase [Pontibacter sp. MBLB2868]|uniref:exopolysaccharide biosynthesis polyprenyl glycosylphosphotransferase n=1 Tax=Pontibacter sp. MBLB2868 TaxID=3451555 RepID=UPI003F751A92